MQAAGGLPIDILIFGVIAVVLVLRLRSILGRRDGFEQKNPPPVAAQPVASNVRPLRPGPIINATAEPLTPLQQTLYRIHTIDPGFDDATFLKNAEAAFRTIVLAYAQGDLATIALLTGAQPQAAFEAAIAQRARDGLTQHAEIRAIEHSEITAASLNGMLAAITVKFVSEQTSYTTNAAGEIVAGHDGRIVIDDVWTFERTLGTPDPTWKLVATHAP